MTRGEMRQRMSGAEYAEWREYYLLEPFGAPRAEHRHADLMTGLFATCGHKVKRELLRPERWMHQPPVADDPDDAGAEGRALLDLIAS